MARRSDPLPPITRLPAYRPAQAEKLPPCQAGCAANGDVRGWIGAVAQRRRLDWDDEHALEHAWRILSAVNPFPATLGRICPHPCELSCNRNGKDEPIAISLLERFVGDWALERAEALPVLATAPSTHAVAVVGAGPAGLSFAYQMARRGHHVTVFERRAEPGGMLRFGIPDYRLPPEVVEGEIARILDLGVDLRLGVAIGEDIGFEDVRRRFDAVFVAAGAQAGRRMGIPGEDHPAVMTGVDYLASVGLGGDPSLGRRVAVVGGGNTAVDAARTARRGGGDVAVLYRRTRAEMPAIASEVDDAIAEGVRFRFLEVPIEVGPGIGGAVAVTTQRMRLGAPDRSGRRRPEPVSGSEDTLEVDSLVVAVAQAPDLGFLGEGVESPADGGFGEVLPGVWVGGDAVDPSIAGTAIRQGRQAAEVVDARLRGQPEGDFDSPEPIGRERIAFHHLPDSPRPLERRVAADVAVMDPTVEVAEGIDSDQFFAEVERCFSCGLCSGCSQCFTYCTLGAFSPVADPVPGHYFEMNLDLCVECGKCIEVCPCGYLEVAGPSPV